MLTLAVALGQWPWARTEVESPVRELGRAALSQRKLEKTEPTSLV